MYKVTHKESGFHHYFNAEEAAVFISKNGNEKYEVKEIKGINWKEVMYASIAFLMIFTLTLAFIYYSTN
jgi:hypothetical protein|tara:strand:- start:1734 stop:1940 length:207 start_codon:yes stop_codon:yes gene_type:complete